MTDNIKLYLPIALVLCCLIYFGGSEAEAAGGYLEGYEEVDPRPTGVSWWSTLAYLLSEITDKDLIEHLHTQAINSGDMFSQEFGTLSGLVKKIPLFKKRN